MKLKEAINRLKYTISKQNKCNQTDADAFNKVMEFLKMSEEETIQDNLLFAKLYSFVLSEFTRHYTDIDFANYQINKLLSETMNYRIIVLTESLKDMEYRNYFNRKKILDPFLKTKTTNELEEIHKRYENLVPQLDPLEFAKCGNNWDFESVKYQLENQINLSLQNYKNHV